MSTERPFLPYGRQSIDADDLAAVSEALRGDYLTTGPTIGKFEAAFAEFVGARHAIASNSGTAALHLACMALDLKPGEAVVVPTLTFLATANAARFCGADVVFADVDPDNGLLTAKTLEAAIARAGGKYRLRAVLPVHVNGFVADMPAIREVADRHGLDVIEDACHALGSVHPAGNGVMARSGDCTLSRMACFSLHPVKTMTTGEGGVTTTNDDGLAERMRLLRNHGMTRDPAAFKIAAQARDRDGGVNPWYYEMHALGPNYRITDFACALGLSQMRKLPRFVARRREIAALYDRLLQALEPAICPVWVADRRQNPALHLYAILVDYNLIGKSRAQVMAELKAQGIGTQVHYLPVHRQPYYRELYGDLDLPGSTRYYDRVLSIPLYPDLTDADVERVVEALGSVIS
ncbi:MAG TPA: UDP-4-amino-4,6-dideoxy-N-acetyl-beta-L-altrosamine transaminase [Alphaproteobacteria bacterium]|nr:UDP-4-amino-4,6-dideoxy-N-acetyl-beta-L-altrosamine transaminase [Alphaproteobacteria bacterium]